MLAPPRPPLCIGVLFLSALAPRLAGQEDGGIPPQDAGLLCEVTGNEVKLSWNIVFVAPIKAWVISRDGEVIAELDPQAASYVDSAVPDGEHMYVLSAINFDGSIGELASCKTEVGDFGIRCRVDGSQVHIEWTVTVRIAFDRFLVRRDGRLIATLPSDVMEFTDRSPSPGLHRYTVHAASVGHEFFIGACTVRVTSEGFVCLVEPPRVILDWSGVVLPAIFIPFFEVIRDGQLIAQVQGTRFVDTPGPGEHHYIVRSGGLDDWLDGEPVRGAVIDPNVPVILVGECTVFVPGGEVPPPEDLVCVGLDAPSPDIVAGIDLLLGPNDVLLVWRIPEGTVYDTVVISRGNAVVGRIPGSQFYFVERDVPPGVHVYSVSGVIAGNVSEPARCEVRIPRPPIEPPRNLLCEVFTLTPAIPPELFVGLRWDNGDAYDWIIIVRNGEHRARLPGDATMYTDREPDPGINVYEVFGAIGLLRSDPAVCRVEVPAEEVPPPEDLRCLVIEPVPGAEGDLGDPDQAGDVVDPATRFGVFLNWSNPVRYDSILIFRNNMQIAALPGSSTSYTDRLWIYQGRIVYSVVGVIFGMRSEAAICEVDLGPPFVPSPRDFQCEVDSSALDPNTGVIVDPNAPGNDPGVDPDAIPVPVVKLSWSNPIRYDSLVLSRDGAVLARLPGSAMSYRDINPSPGRHVYSLYGVDANGNRSRAVTCEVVVGDTQVPPVEDLTCVNVDTSSAGPSAALSWSNPIEYTAILVMRDGEVLERLPGDATSFVDRGLDPGVYRYGVVALVGNLRSPPRSCQVVIPGPPGNVLYFSSGLFGTDDLGNAIPDPANQPGSITCLASHSDPIQAWSFGVCSDPSALQLADVDLDGTDAGALNGGAGPSFLSISRFDEGVTMAAVIDQNDPADVLPPASRHSLLNIRYERGADTATGDCVPVRYCNTLGDPPVAVLYVVEGFEVVPRTLGGRVCFPPPPPPRFLRGDASNDLEVNITDGIVVLGWLFLGEAIPPCLEAADANASVEINVADAVYIFQALFIGGPPPPPPFPDCGSVALRIGCEESACPMN